MKLISADLVKVLDSRQLPHIYQQLYHDLSQKPIHNQGCMDGYDMSTQMGEE